MMILINDAVETWSCHYRKTHTVKNPYGLINSVNGGN